MIRSSQPRNQRRYRYNAPMHVKQKYLHVHIAKDLRKKMNIKKRAIQIRKGDTVKVLSGKFKGKTGKINMVSLNRNRVFIDGIIRKTAKGKEIQIPIYSSKVAIIDLDLTDKFRKEKLGVKETATAAKNVSQ